MCYMEAGNDNIAAKSELVREAGGAGISTKEMLLNLISQFTAPGFNISAAFPGGPNEFGIDSGTSMSAPHVTGVAFTIRATNKRWSVAAIKSAIMTTAIVNDNTGGPIQSGAGPATPFDFGSGHLEPDLALSP
ncbi:hypothetical protein LWI28_023242 [Acer negundo]|uniref:Peptidase S8/S53 domain-containing protein n=1 Tax=Acer negundo TaxID=4023 RepID=A0AAD5I792_ACENE|nr:hypothetical protein LWI28_023242 [Acer negundo]